MCEGMNERRLGAARQLSALHEAALAITAELSLDKVLQKIVDVARDLMGARYAALAVSGEDGKLTQFVYAGVTAAEARGIGALPGGSKGLLGALLRSAAVLRVPDISAHPDSCGFPVGHPPMMSFLGAPLVSRGRVVGCLYLTEKVEAREFTAEDESLVEMLAAQAAVAVENARLFSLTDEALRHKVEELQLERGKLKAIIDQMPEGVAILDAVARGSVLLNSAAAKLLAIGGQGEAPAAALRLVQASGETLPFEETAIYRAVANGEMVTGDQMILTRADGTSFTALTNAAPLFDSDGRIAGGIVVFQDISPLKELERLKDELISIISHELRNPLTAIRGRAQLMLRLARRAGRDADVVGLEAIDAQVEKLAGMVRELLDVSQMRLGLVELKRQPTDLVLLLRQSVEQFQAADEVHTFRLETVAEHLVGNWDRLRLEQVIYNLLENARKYSPNGGTITVRVAEDAGPALGKLVAELSPQSTAERRQLEDDDARWALVEVSDVGIGIPKEAQAHLFDRFYRAANAKGRAETGLGLGLYICHEVIAKHGGSLWVKSVEGQGSTFYIALPL